eukprot:COSAG01_NODE_15171_length_1366_cov_1.018153_1_plen_269_part_00
MKSWFFIDLFSVLPLDQVLLEIGRWMVKNSSSNKETMVGEELLFWSVEARLLRLLRLVRLAKIKQLLRIDDIVRYLHKVLKNLGASKLQVAFYFRFLFLVCLILLTAHGLSCYWVYLGRYNVLQLANPRGWMYDSYLQYDANGLSSANRTKDFITCSGNGFDAKSWNSKHGPSCNSGPYGFGCSPIPVDNPYDVNCDWIYDRSTLGKDGTGDANGVGAAEQTQYLAAFYFCLVTLTTVGYGDLLPVTDEEIQFVMFAILLGAFLYACE